jgi:hypothetical protein
MRILHREMQARTLSAQQYRSGEQAASNDWVNSADG